MCQDVEHGLRGTHPLCRIELRHFARDMVEERLQVTIALGFVGRMPAFIIEAPDEHRHLRAEMHRLVGRQPVPDRMQDRAQYVK